MPRRTRTADADSRPSDTPELPDLFAASPVRWSEVDGNVLRALLDALTSQGHAALFGRSSDGGALHATFYVGGSKPDKYFRTAPEFEEFARGYTEWLLDRQMHP